MSQETILVALTNLVGADIKAMNVAQGSLSSLTTTVKTSLVAAINEVKASLASSGAQINDSNTSATTTVLSASKVTSEIAEAKLALKNELTNGAGAALDQLNELANAINNDPTFATTIASQIANRVRFDAAQVLTTPQKLQVCENIGIGDPEVDLVAIYTAAKA